MTVARFIEGLRQANGIIAGISCMPWRRRFLPFNILGAALWVGLWTTVGYTAGSHINSIYHEIGRYEIYLGVALGVLILGYIGFRLRKRRKKRDGHEPPGGPLHGGAAGTDVQAVESSKESSIRRRH